MGIDLFTNDNYQLLKLLYDNQTTVLDKRVIPLTQGEISRALGMSKAKINVMFGNLQEYGFISQESRGKYCLLPKGVMLVEGLKKLDTKLDSRMD